MIEQYLLNTNEIATVLILPKNFGTKQGSPGRCSMQHCLSGPSKYALKFVVLHFSQLCSYFSPLFHTSRCIFNCVDKQCLACRLSEKL